MITPTSISALSSIVDWTIKITNGPTNNVGVFVTLSLPAGWSIAPGEVLQQGTLAGNIWTIGSMTPGQMVTGVIKLTNSTLVGSPWNFIATVTGLDTNPGNNILTDTVLYGACPTCPPAGGAIDDPFSCLCGNVSTNDTRCTSGTSSWVLDPGSLVNCIMNNFNSVTGEYNITLIDPTLPWSFEYSLWCDIGGGPLEISGPAVVSGTPIFSSWTIAPKLVKEDFIGVPGATAFALSSTPLAGYDVFVYRNGVEQPFSEYSVAGNIVTIVTPMSASGGAAFSETLSVHYYI